MNPVGSSTLPIGDLSALSELGLEAVGVVQGVSVGSINPLRTFHEGSRRLNRGPGYRPGRGDAYFGFLWDKPAEIALMMTPTGLYASWQQAVSHLRTETFDENLPEPNWANTSAAGFRSTKWGPWYALRTKMIRRWGLELQNAATISWYPGLVFESGENTDDFARHFNAAHDQLRAGAVALGADGVIGIVDSVSPLLTMGASEFRMMGTAVRRTEAAGNGSPFTTYLSAQSLIKLLETGRMPLEITSQYVNLVAVHTPISDWLRKGQSVSSKEITEFQRFRELGYELVRRRIQQVCAGDELHGVTLEHSHHDAGRLVATSETRIRGTRVRRFDEQARSLLPMAALDLA